MIKEKFEKLKKIKLSKETKKIITTAIITLLVFLFFIWLGVGMYIYTPEESKTRLWPLFIMYLIFPGLIFVFGAKRIYGIVNGNETFDEELPREEENIE